MCIEAVLERLEGVACRGSGWSARCPAHEDRNPSLSISTGDDGRILLKCFGGCETREVVDAIGLSMRDLMPDRDSPFQATTSTRNGFNGRKAPTIYESPERALASLRCRQGEPSKVWRYHDAHEGLVGLVVRFETADGKTIRPISKVDGGWSLQAMPSPRPLYRLSDLQPADQVLVIEGEKTADAVRSIGLVATTSAGGSNAARQTDWAPLADKDVVILPDNDGPGAKYATDVEQLAIEVGARSVRIVHLPGLGPKEDAFDWIEGFGDSATPECIRDELLALLGGPARSDDECEDHLDRNHWAPFPIDSLPEPIRGFVAEGSAAIGCDPSYLSLPVLSVCASAIGATRRLLLKRGWSVPSIVWTAVIGESGSQKSPPFRLALKPLHAIQRAAMEEYAEDVREHEIRVALYDRKLKDWKGNKRTTDDPPVKPEAPEPRSVLVSDTTIEALAPILKANPRGLLLARDELSGWIGGFDRYSNGAGDAAQWLSMFDGESIVVDRKTGTPRKIYVAESNVSIVGGIQPEILRSVLGKEHRQNGLAARFLFANPPRHAKRWTERDISLEAESAYAGEIERLMSLEPTVDENGVPGPVLLYLSPEARRVWIEFYERHADEQIQLDGDLAAAWSKLEQAPARLAIILHCIANDGTKIDVTTMENAIRLTEWFKNESRRVYQVLSERPEDRDRRVLLEWIEKQGGEVTKRQVQRKFQARFPSSDLAEVALRALVDAGYGTYEVVSAGSNGGRRKEVFSQKLR